MIVTTDKRVYRWSSMTAGRGASVTFNIPFTASFPTRGGSTWRSLGLGFLVDLLLDSFGLVDIKKNEECVFAMCGNRDLRLIAPPSIAPFPPSISNSIPTPEADKALVTRPDLRISMGGDDHLLSIGRLRFLRNYQERALFTLSKNEKTLERIKSEAVTEDELQTRELQRHSYY
ncbi:hypothetical protein EVAR_36308_1 [Eumeta japonica]|uniref:Uncharacterized protein n=1 Tax=Eumeta variegata TaxID=151549 RepID=A0A4C1VHD5_EUMVA|nr:hypothetical protein EVAR_36308_1 [Eumeta japonica]